MKEKLKHIRIDLVEAYRNIGRAIDTVDLALQHVEPFATITSAYWENGKIVVEFETNVDIDIRYWFGDKVHEVEDYIDEIDQSEGRFKIGVNQFDKNWNVQVFGEGVESEIVNVGPFKKEPEQPINLKPMMWGWWDPLLENESIDNFPFCNTIKTFGDNVGHALNSDIKYVVPSVGMPDGLSDSKIKQRLEHQCRHFINETTDRIPFWIVQDEPKYGVEYQERLIEICKQVVPNIPATFSYSGTHMWKGRGIAQNIEHVHWNDYPFRGIGYPSEWGDVITKEDFMRKHDELMALVKSNSPEGATFSITTQTFAGLWKKDDRWKWKFREPPKEAPLWFAEFINKYNLIGGLHYLLRDPKEEMVANDMPDLMENVEKVYNEIKDK